MHLYNFVDLWKFSEIFSSFLRFFEIFGEFRRLLEIFGEFWRFLGTFGDIFCQCFEQFKFYMDVLYLPLFCIPFVFFCNYGLIKILTSSSDLLLISDTFILAG